MSEPMPISDLTLVVQPSRCIGCRTCELACAFGHAAPGAQLGVSRVRVYPVGPERFLPLLCLQCDDAACVKVCPVGALVRNPTTGAIELSAERCVRCRLCVVACPFGNLQLGSGPPQPVVRPTAGEVVKCDLCHGDPACARFCPTGALQYRPPGAPDRPGPGTGSESCAAQHPTLASGLPARIPSSR